MKTITKILVVVAVGAVQVVTLVALYQRGHSIGRVDGYAEGFKKALDTREPSDELEITCAALWIGEQTKKHLERTK
jgi:hypothetical protein